MWSLMMPVLESMSHSPFFQGAYILHSACFLLLAYTAILHGAKEAESVQKDKHAQIKRKENRWRILGTPGTIVRLLTVRYRNCSN